MLNVKSHVIIYANISPDVGENVICKLASVAIRYQYSVSTQLTVNASALDTELRDVCLILGCHSYKHRGIKHAVPYLGYLISTLTHELTPAPEIFDLASDSLLFHHKER